MKWIARANELPYRIFYIREGKYITWVSPRKNLLDALAQHERELNEQLAEYQLPSFSLFENYMKDFCDYQTSADILSMLKTKTAAQKKFLEEYAGKFFGDDGKKKLARKMLEKLPVHPDAIDAKQVDMQVCDAFATQMIFNDDHRTLVSKQKIGLGSLGANLDENFMTCFDAVTQREQDKTVTAKTSLWFIRGVTDRHGLNESLNNIIFDYYNENPAQPKKLGR